MKKGLIFDVDGTLWDSAANVAVSWNLATEEAGIQRDPITEADIKSLMGKTMDVFARVLFPFMKEEDGLKHLNICCLRENDYLREHGGVLYPDLRGTLEILKEKYHLYIVSNCQSGYIEAFLDYNQMWDLFEDIECYGNNGQPKDYNIRLLAERNELTEAAYIGDIQSDCDATEKAGFAFIHAAYGFGTIDHEVPAIQNLAELPQVADQVLDAPHI